MESGSPKAVFLSYAREDTAAAQRIAEALRSHGVEVWFDQNELRGGDAWDAKIRKQIDTCALFIPIISRHTEERAKGYFRLEWKLAVEQTHLLMEGVPFLVPVVVDDTPDSTSVVPAEFRRVQWTRLSGALPTAQFVEQVKRLLDAPRKSAAEPKAFPGSGPFFPTVKVRSGVPALAFVTLGVLVVGLGAYIIFRPFAKEAPTAAAQVAVEPKPALAAPEPSVTDKSIAVLPFENMSEDKGNAYFCDGVQEDILTDLANISELRVVSRTSVEQYRGTTKPIRQIARELGVAWVLEGSVQREGNKVRVTGQLINAATDEHKWAKAYDRDLSDIFAIQSELAETIASSLEAAISPQEKDLVESKPTESLTAYELVLKARQLQNIAGWDLGKMQEMERLLSSAVQLDPNYALAYDDLTFIYAFSDYFMGSSLDVARDHAWLAKAKDAIDAAVRLAPDSPDTVRGLGDFYYYGYRDFAKATDEYEKLARLRPNDSTAYLRLAAIQRRQARWAESVTSFRKADELDPGNLNNVRDLAILFAAGRRFEDAIKLQRRVVAGQPDNMRSGFDLAELAFIGSGSTHEMEHFFKQLPPGRLDSEQSYAFRKLWAVMHGDLAEAIRIDRLHPYYDGPGGNSASHLSQAIEIAVALAAQGDKAGARARLENFPAELRARVESVPQDYASWANLAKMEAILGQREEALRCADKGCELMPESRDALLGAGLRASLAFVYAWTGEKDAAFAEYARLLRIPFGSFRGGPGGFPAATINVMKVDPIYAPLRGYPAFEALLNDPKNNEPLF